MLPLLPPMPPEIRDATPEDASAACGVMKRSIAELCAADHRNDETILTRWLGNKTPEIFETWIRQADNSLLVAVEDEAIIAVGSVTDAGEITLNYVSPDARFRGVSKAMLGALERRAAARGNSRCTLTSTETARRFYLANGYVEDGAPVGTFGTSSGYPMVKSLQSADGEPPLPPRSGGEGSGVGGLAAN
jgi:GNAT superfamily N-acetyltransferase